MIQEFEFLHGIAVTHPTEYMFALSEMPLTCRLFDFVRETLLLLAYSSVDKQI